jgi:hypothetical protein
MVPRGLDGKWQLLRTGLRQGAGRHPEKGLVPDWLARERQLLHPLTVCGCEHPWHHRHCQMIAGRPGSARIIERHL